MIRKRLIGFLAAASSALLLWWSAVALYAGDACADAGGSFNYLALACDFQQNHASFFAFILAAGPLSLLVGLLGVWAMVSGRAHAP
jgi:hypothetical protein